MNSSLSLTRLALQGLRHHWRLHLSVALGCVVATSALVGALLTGESVTHTLQEFALMRLGTITHVVASGDRLFGEAWTERCREQMAAPVAAVLMLPGVAILDEADGTPGAQVNRVQVLGVTSNFWAFSPIGGPRLPEDGVALGRKLADALGAHVGDRVSLRVPQPSLLPRDAPLASRQEGLSRRGLLQVTAIVEDAGLGRFSLQGNQIAPYNAFVARSWLQRAVALEGQANLMLAGSDVGASEATAAAAFEAALARSWRLEFGGFTLTSRLEGDPRQLETSRIFMDAGSVMPTNGPDGAGVLTYLVSSIDAADAAPARRTPYSFMAACAPGASTTLVPAEMTDDQILISQWLATELTLGPGDRCQVRYHELQADGSFREASRSFVVRDVLAMSALERERALMPPFPGLTDVESCRDWDIGMPMDEERLRDPANEAYWQAYGATPKAIVTLAAGQAMWANRYGDLSAVRYPSTQSPDALRTRLREAIEPAALGFVPLAIRARATQAVAQSLNLGEYFLGMSFFLIVAALLLTGLLFVFGMQTRAGEAGVLLSMGYHPCHVAGLFLMEGAVVAGVGCLCGALAGIGYTRLLLAGLASFWQGAVAGSAIQFHVDPATLCYGAAGGYLAAMVPLALAVRALSRRQATTLLQGDFTQSAGVGKAAGKRGVLPVVIGLSVVGAAALLVWASAGVVEHAVTVFFGAGALLLNAGLCGVALLLRALERRVSDGLDLGSMGLRNAARRRGRSLTAVGLLACGSFMVFAVSSMQENLTAHADARHSGTGGFDLVAESTIPLPDPLGSARSADDTKLAREPALAGAGYVSIKVRAGDDASCLNLNQAQAPRLLGVTPEDFMARQAFAKASDATALWRLLELPLGEDEIPGLVGDADTAMWNLQQRTDPLKGGTILYTDERGQPFKVRLVGKLPMRLSVFQGTVLINAADFAERFPSESGYRLFLVDGVADAAAAARGLARRLDRMGVDVTTALQRLLEFYAVESTYLGMFLVLGGLGLLLGSVGMGVVVLRNILERRHELALLRCVGFSRRQICLVVIAEHWLLLALGLLIGVVTAVVAIWPNMTVPGVEMPYRLIGAILGTVFLVGLLWIALVAMLALRGELLAPLREE